MQNTYAVIKDEIVVNIILLDDSLFEKNITEFDFGGELVLVKGNGGIGWGYDGQNFIAPPAPEPTKEEIKTQAINYRDYLLAVANSITDDWKTELTLGIISDEDKESLIAWMNYIKAVKAIDLSLAPNIIWPSTPE